jgi:hypothetical protein
MINLKCRRFHAGRIDKEEAQSGGAVTQAGAQSFLTEAA